jgi:hypothetical protein
MLMAQARSILRRSILQPSSGEKRQAKEKLRPVTLGRMLMWVGAASLLVSCALLAYIVGALLARFVVWLF